MRDFIILFIQGIMDSIEEFFSSLTVPSSKFTFKAFVYAVVFLVMSIVLEMFDMPCFVSWQEALTCVILMSIIVLIDGSVRGNIKKGMSSLKSIADKFSYAGEENEEDLPVDDMPIKEEDVKDGTN